eukprot:1536684-Amphidinium_carterae.1
MGCFLYNLSLSRVQRQQAIDKVKFARKFAPTTVLGLQAIVGTAETVQERARLIKSAFIAALGQDTNAAMPWSTCGDAFVST